MSDLLARLIESGTPAALVAEVARELARAEVAQEAIDARREKDRQRQQAKRERDNVMSRDTTDVTTETSLSRPPNEINSNPPTHTHEINIPRAREAFPRPEFADPQHWADFLQNRKRKKLPNTMTAHAKLLRDIAKLSDDDWPPGKLIEYAAAKGWGGIYDPREQEDHHAKPQFTSNRPPAKRSSLDAIIAARHNLGAGG